MNLAAYHMPVIDLDVPCTLVESRTKGHYHLLVHKPVAWSRYLALLRALAAAGLVEDGYVKASDRRGQSFARIRPGVNAKTYAGLAAQDAYRVTLRRRIWNVLRGRHPEDIDF